MNATNIAKHFKDVCSQLAAGVTIITTKNPDSKSGFHAMTATAFMPLSLAPPLILVAIEKKNETHGFFNRSKSVFGVSLLAEDHSEISTRYASKDPSRYGFEGIDTFTGPSGSVLVSGCAAAIEAEISDMHDAGDHSIFIGKVGWLEAFADKKPLVYWQREYHFLGKNEL